MDCSSAWLTKQKTGASVSPSSRPYTMTSSCSRLSKTALGLSRVSLSPLGEHGRERSTIEASSSSCTSSVWLHHVCWNGSSVWLKPRHGSIPVLSLGLTRILFCCFLLWFLLFC